MTVTPPNGLLTGQKKKYPKPCLASAADISRAFHISEIEPLASMETISRFLNQMLEYENKVDTALNQPTNPIPLSPNSRSQKQVNLMFPNQNQIILPEIDEIPDYQPPVYPELSFSKFGFSNNPQSNLHTSFTNPKINFQNFNGSISELAHFALSVQTCFNVRSDVKIVPVPFMTVLFQNGKQLSLYVPEKLPRDSETVFSTLSSSLTEFGILINLIITIAGEKLQIDTSNLIPYLTPDLNDFVSDSTQNSKWQKMAEQHLQICDFFILVLQQCAEQQLKLK